MGLVAVVVALDEIVSVEVVHAVQSGLSYIFIDVLLSTVRIRRD